MKAVGTRKIFCSRQNMLCCTCWVRTRGREQSHWEDPPSQWLFGGRCTVSVDWNTWPLCSWLQFLLRRLTLVLMLQQMSRQTCKWQSHPKSKFVIITIVSIYLVILMKLETMYCKPPLCCISSDFALVVVTAPSTFQAVCLVRHSQTCQVSSQSCCSQSLPAVVFLSLLFYTVVHVSVSMMSMWV